MKNHKSEEAFYERMRNLAQVNKSSLKESQNRTLGTLIDSKRADNGVAYGIIKEQHKYYIKKGGLNENLNVSDFAYIGGLSNITDYQYNKLSEAEKQMNMLLKSINEGISSKIDKNGSKKNSKKVLTEDKASQEIEMAADKVDDLDAATNAAEISSEPTSTGEEDNEEMNAGIDAMPDNNIDKKDEIPAEEMPIDDKEDNKEIPNTDNKRDESTKEIEKNLGKLTNTLRKTELTDSQVISYVKTFLAAFKEKFPDIDIEDRKEMAEKITKVVPPEDIEDLGQNVEDTDDNAKINIDTKTTEIDEENCNECGGFAKYAESRGYNADSIKECGEEEMTNLISGYANANSEGQNDGDFKVIALFITPEILNKLKDEYGHEEFANHVEPFSQEMNETTPGDRDTQINELFGGLKNLAKDAGQGIKRGAQNVAQKVGSAATAVKQSYHTGELPKEVKKLENYAAQLGQQIGALNNRMIKAGKEPINVQSILTTIKNQIASGGAANLSKYTNEEGIPVDHTEVQPMMGRNNIKEDIEEKEEDLNIDDLDVGDEESPEIKTSEFSNGFDTIGGGVVKPEGSETTTVEVTKDSVNVNLNENKPSAGLTKKEKSNVVKKAKAGKDIGKKGKNFEKIKDKATKEYGNKEKGEKVAAAAMWKNIAKNENIEKEVEEGNKFTEKLAKTPKNTTFKIDGKTKVDTSNYDGNINESERKLRKYIRNRLEEHAGIRKPILNENKKSETIQKLDRIIDKQFKLFENTTKEKINSVNEVFGLSLKEKFQKLDPNDTEAIENLFKKVYSSGLGLGQAIKNIANQTPTDEKYKLLKKYFENNGGTIRVSKNKLIYQPESLKQKSISSKFAGGGTQGKTTMGGV